MYCNVSYNHYFATMTKLLKQSVITIQIYPISPSNLILCSDSVCDIMRSITVL